MIRFLNKTISDNIDRCNAVRLKEFSEIIPVGAGQKFTTINAALQYISRYRFKFTLIRPYFNIQLQSGFVMQEQVLVSRVNLGHVVISSIDAEVVVARSYLTTIFTGRYPAFGGNYAIMPVISCLFNMDTTGDGVTRDGIYLAQQSEILTTTNCGFKNAGSLGAYINYNSRAMLANSIFTGSGLQNIQAQKSFVSAGGAVATTATGYGIYAGQGGVICATGANSRKNISVNGTADFAVQYGGYITLDSSSIGGTNVTVNTLSGAGVITKT